MDDDKLIQITKPADGASLCLACRWVHLQRGYRESEVAVFCNFAARYGRCASRYQTALTI
jgi:hypothetical protein